MLQNKIKIKKKKQNSKAHQATMKENGILLSLADCDVMCDNCTLQWM